MIYHLNIMTWWGIAPGAIHYFGNIEANYRSKEDFPTVKLDGGHDLYSEEAVIAEARKYFKKHIKRGDILLKGNHCSCDPQEVLIGPREFKKVGNALHFLAEEIGGWESERQMKPISKAWDELCDEYA